MFINEKSSKSALKSVIAYVSISEILVGVQDGDSIYLYAEKNHSSLNVVLQPANDFYRYPVSFVPDFTMYMLKENIRFPYTLMDSNSMSYTAYPHVPAHIMKAINEARVAFKQPRTETTSSNHISVA